MTVKAQFDGRTFVPEKPLVLPPGTRVDVIVPEADAEGPLQGLLALAESAPITDAPADWSEQLDHHVYGTPRK